nr:MAG TPA: hypothetical protein [Caudoviricetes sp.]
MFDRKKSPLNTEELMISEYIRLRDELAKTREDLEDEKAYSESLEQQMRDMEDAFKATNQKRDERLKQVEEQATGIIDLHTTKEIRKLSVWSSYRVKDWIEEQHVNSKITALDELLHLPDIELINKASKEMRASYAGHAIDIDERTVKYVMSLPWGDGRRTILYAPQIDEGRFIMPVNSATTDRWTTASKEAVEHYAIKCFREAISDAIDSIKEKED